MIRIKNLQVYRDILPKSLMRAEKIEIKRIEPVKTIEVKRLEVSNG